MLVCWIELWGLGGGGLGGRVGLLGRFDFLPVLVDEVLGHMVPITSSLTSVFQDMLKERYTRLVAEFPDFKTPHDVSGRVVA